MAEAAVHFIGFPGFSGAKGGELLPLRRFLPSLPNPPLTHEVIALQGYCD